MNELLAPAGNLQIAKTALYSGCDAIYLGAQKFGARAYAKNFSMEDLKTILILAHELGKKIYVTVNTIIKENELDDCFKMLDELYELGVDGIITTDFALINYIINNLYPMEAHVSTQSGVKTLEDALFFQDLGAVRCVLARENSVEEIKRIKKYSDIELEVFMHGALCVSYSGGCLLSSLLSLRSGNRGRCSQNCRREYEIYKNDKLLAPKGYHLSMKDLNTSSNLRELLDLGIASFKLEGRMKNASYVKTITKYYRNVIDKKPNKEDSLNEIFHRTYTKGFIFNDDNGSIGGTKLAGSEGELIGNILGYKNGFTKIKLSKPIIIKDRLKIDDYYFTIDVIYDDSFKKIDKASSTCYLNIYKKLPQNSEVYRVLNASVDDSFDNTYKRGIDITVSGKEGDLLKLECEIDGNLFEGYSNLKLEKSLNRPIDNDTLYKQISKLNDTSFYLNKLNNKLEGNLFIVIKEINEARRMLVNNINDFYQNKRELIRYEIANERFDYPVENLTLTAFCYTNEQKHACEEMGIKYIYFDNYASYATNKYKDTNSDYELVGNYGGIYHYKNKELIADYSFNAINSKAIYELHKSGVKYVTLSVESSYNTLKEIYNGYIKNYDTNPNLEMLVYGKLNLMTMKYCPLKKYGECGKCKENNYYLKDEFATFPILHEGCITHILNGKNLNLIDELINITPFVKRLRLQFTTEDYEETKNIIKMYQQRINNLNDDEKLFNSKTDTLGYYKREII